MTELKQGDKVKVSYEAEFFADLGEMIQLKVGETYLYAPKGATIEAIRPEVKEPTAFGALVEVDGVKYVRAASDTYRWRGNDEWESWEDLERMGDVKVLFDPDAPVAPAPEAHPALRDEEGDVWHWQETGDEGPGYYTTVTEDGVTDVFYKPNRQAVDDSYGPVTVVA